MKVLTLQNKRSAGRFNAPFCGFKEDGNQQPLALIAEDHDDTRALLKTLLMLWGFRVVEADNGREAVELCLQEKPSIILMDIVLPTVDGLQAAQQIRRLEKTRNIPIVFITGYIGSGIELVAQACGGDDFIEKPFDLPLLQATVAKYHPNLNKLRYA